MSSHSSVLRRRLYAKEMWGTLAATFSCAVAAHRHESRVGIDWACSIRSGISNGKRSWALVSRGLSADTTHSSYYRNLACGGRASHSRIVPRAKYAPSGNGPTVDLLPTPSSRVRYMDAFIRYRSWRYQDLYSRGGSWASSDS